MSEGAISIAKAVPIIAITWILSLLTTVAVVYLSPSLFPTTITADNIADGAIITAKLADGNVTSAKILDGTLAAADISDGSIIAIKVADGAVTTTKIADGAVTTDHIDDDAIVTIKLADGSVTSAKILDGAVMAVDLHNGSVITAKIANGAVTAEKIADYSVTDLKLASGAIPHNITHVNSTSTVTIGSTSFENMPGMSVELTLKRNSTLIIIPSVMIRVTGTAPRATYWRAIVNSTLADPIRTSLATTGWTVITEDDRWSSHSFAFYVPNVTPGTYVIKIQWRVFEIGETGSALDRSLTALALPA